MEGGPIPTRRTQPRRSVRIRWIQTTAPFTHPLTSGFTQVHHADPALSDGPSPEEPAVTRLYVHFACARVTLVMLPQTLAVEWSAASANHDRGGGWP